MKHYGDIKKLSGYDLPIVDCITGGSPCQDLSIAGPREGLDGERSCLFLDQIRIVREMREHDARAGRTGRMVRPRFMVWENVPGAFSSNGGKDFQRVLTEIVRISEPEAPDVPLPVRGGWTKSGCLYSDMGRWSIAWRLHDAQFWGTPQRRKRIALVADFGGLSAPEVLFERKGMSWDSAESGAQENESAQGTGVGFDETSGHETPVIYDARGNGDGYTVPTITGGHNGNISDYTAVAIGNGQLHNISMKPIANTLDAMHDGQACLVPNVSHTLRSTGDCAFGADVETYVETGEKAARRLTPLENERLQGFPDGWTDIGEWMDQQGRRHRPADAPRYKAIGNAIATPFWFWLLRRISAHYERPATLGSLFDGIGGFPLCWERCNGPGTAIWASEIEEFCIAVTKRHFPEIEGGSKKTWSN